MCSSSLKCLLWGLQVSSGLQLSVPFFSSSGWRRSSGTRRTTSGSSSWRTSLRASSSFSPNARSSIRRITPGCSSRYTTPFIQSLQASLYYGIPSVILVKMEGYILYKNDNRFLAFLSSYPLLGHSKFDIWSNGRILSYWGRDNFVGMAISFLWAQLQNLTKKPKLRQCNWRLTTLAKNWCPGNNIFILLSHVVLLYSKVWL